MRIGVRAPQLAAFKRRFNNAPLLVSQEMRAGLESSVKVLQDHIRSEAHSSFRPFIVGQVHGSGADLRGEVTGDTKAKPHMAWQNWGTATRRIGGARSPYSIFPKFATVLRFVWNGKLIFANRILNHPGIFGKQFFQKGQKAALPTIRRILGGHLGSITKSLHSGGGEGG